MQRWWVVKLWYVTCKVQSERATASQVSLATRWSKLQHVLISVRAKHGHGKAPAHAPRHTFSCRGYMQCTKQCPGYMKGEPKARAQKQYCRLYSVNPSDHCGRDLEGTAFHPDCDRVLLWGRAQVDHVSSHGRPLGGSGGRLDRRTYRGDICGRHGQGEPLRSR